MRYDKVKLKPLTEAGHSLRSCLMADLALYRKHRPQTFQHLVGQDHVRRTLLNAIKAGHLSHAYLFCGPRGTGKTTTARLVAKAINCINPSQEGESCGKCAYCVMMSEGRLVDLIEIDAASNRGIDEIRDLREKIKFAPSQAPHKVYIIDEVHMMTTPAFNALLKTLEEPPSHAYFILATTEVHKLPETIISRCQRFDFHRIDEAVMIERLKEVARTENVKFEEAGLALIAKAAEGGLRNAISLLEQIASGGILTEKSVREVLGLTGSEAVERLLTAMEKREIPEALKEIQTLHREGQDLFSFNRDVLEALRQRLLATSNKKESSGRYLGWIELFQKASQELKNALIPQLPLEVAVIKACLWGEEAKGGWLSSILGTKSETKAEEKPAETKPSDLKTVKLKPSAKSSTDGLVPLPQEAPDDPAPFELALVNLQSHLPRIVDSIKTPSLRQSFRSGMLQNLQGVDLHVEFQSQFHLEKVNTAPGKAEIEAAFQKVTGHKLRLNFALGEMKKTVDATLEIFGGEMIE